MTDKYWYMKFRMGQRIVLEYGGTKKFGNIVICSGERDDLWIVDWDSGGRTAVQTSWIRELTDEEKTADVQPHHPQSEIIARWERTQRLLGRP